MVKTVAALFALILLGAAACGGDDSSPEAEEPAQDESSTEEEVADTGEPLEDQSDDQPEGPVHLDLDMDELTEATDELFDGHDWGRGMASAGPSSELFVDVEGDELTDDELLAGCEGLVDFLFEQPEDVAAGPVWIKVSDIDGEGDEEAIIVGNDGVVIGEERGTCELGR